MSAHSFTTSSHKRRRLLQVLAMLIAIISCSTSAAGSQLPQAPRSGLSTQSSRVQTAGTAALLPDTGTERELTLEQALAIALENNPELLAARQEITITRGHLSKARYWNPFNPHIALGAGRREFDQGGSDIQPEAEMGLELEIAGQRSKRIQEAEQALGRVHAEVDDFGRVLTARVKETFYRSLYLLRRLELFRRTSELNSRMRKATALRFRSGDVGKLDENLAVIREGRSRRDVFRANLGYKNALAELERLLGREPTGGIEPTGRLEIEPVSFDLETLLAAAMDSRPDLVAHNAELQRLKAEQELTRRSRIPNVTLGAFYEEEAESGGETDRIIGGRLSFPLPIFERKQAELGASSGRQARADYDRQATVLTIRTEVVDAYRAHDAAARVLSLYEAEALGRVEENFRLIETAYREGKIDLLELVVVQNDLFEAEFSYIEALWEYRRAAIALERAVGRPLSPPRPLAETN